MLIITLNSSSLISFSPHTSYPLKCFEQKILVNSLITYDKCKIIYIAKDNILLSSKSNASVKVKNWYHLEAKKKAC